MTDPIKTTPKGETETPKVEATETKTPTTNKETPTAKPITKPDQPTQPKEAVREKVIEKVIVKAPEPDPLPIPQSNAGAWPIMGVLVVTLVLSYAIQRLNHHPAFSPVRRWLPVAQIAIWCVAVLLLGALTIQHLPIEWFYFELVLLVLLVMVNQSWLRSVLSGAALTLEGKFKKGDIIRVEELEGEILSFGLRAVRLRAIDGTLHDIPNHQLTSNSIANLSGDGGDSACEVEVTVPEAIPLPTAMALAVEAAMLSPLASPRHKPEVFLSATGKAPHQLRVRGYAFDPNFQEHFRSDVVTRILERYEESLKQGAD